MNPLLPVVIVLSLVVIYLGVAVAALYRTLTERENLS